MNVAELIRLLEKVNTKGATVFMDDSENIEHMVDRVIVEHDMDDDEVVVVLKPEM